MKIDKPYENYNNYIQKNVNKEIAKEEIKIPKEKNIDVQISDSTKRLLRSINESKNEGISERVENIKKSILQGLYKVDEKTIAKKIMDNIYVQEGEKINE